MKVVGVDGCKYGWCSAINCDGIIHINIYKNIEKLLLKSADVDAILIDIPIGLGDEFIVRDLDFEVKKHLERGKKSSIFIPPVREALSAANYEIAKNINKRITGKKISIQSWNISKKIKEIDDLLNLNPEYRSLTKEAHPEICFKYLNHGKSLQFKKQSPNKSGIQERLNILENYEPEIKHSFERARQKFNRKEVKDDDIVDALCLMVTATLGVKDKFQYIKGASTPDSRGLEMCLVYYLPEKA